MNPLDEKELAEWYMRAHGGDSVKAKETAAKDLELQPSNCVLSDALQILSYKANRKEQIAYPKAAEAKIG